MLCLLSHGVFTWFCQISCLWSIKFLLISLLSSVMSGWLLLIVDVGWLLLSVVVGCCSWLLLLSVAVGCWLLLLIDCWC